MKIRNLLLCGVLLFPIAGIAQTKQVNPVVQAALNAYEEELTKNPKDFNMLYARANQYFLMEEYLKALDDVTNALKYTSRDDAAVLFDEFELRAKIYYIREDYQNALNDINEALKLDSSNIQLLFLRGDVNYSLGNYAASKNDYQQILKTNNINYDAFAGLAKVAVKENNFGQAREYVNKAVSLYPAQAAVYVNRAEVLSMLGEDNAAAHDLITAVSLNYENSDALPKLVAMSKTDYKAVVDALDDACQKAPDSAMLKYLRSSIRLSNNDYAGATKDMSRLIGNKLYNTAGIYYDYAEALYNLGNYKEAISNINQAIMQDADQGPYYVLRAKIQLALGFSQDALNTINSSLSVDKNDVSALEEKAQVLLAKNQPKEALASINEAIVNDSENPLFFLVRGWIQSQYLNSKNDATNDYKRIIALPDNNGVKSYKGFALHFLGRNVEAKSWIENMIQSNNVAGGEIYYYASILYSLCGDDQKALDYLEGALANGYGSYHNIMKGDEAGLSLGALRKLPRFAPLMDQYKSNFAY